MRRRSRASNRTGGQPVSSSAEFAAWLRRCQRRARAHTRNASMGMDPLMTSEHRAERCRAHSSGRRASESSSSMHCYALLCSAMQCYGVFCLFAVWCGVPGRRGGEAWSQLARPSKGSGLALRRFADPPVLPFHALPKPFRRFGAWPALMLTGILMS